MSSWFSGNDLARTFFGEVLYIQEVELLADKLMTKQTYSTIRSDGRLLWNTINM